jgi:hypothetical protein
MLYAYATEHTQRGVQHTTNTRTTITNTADAANIATQAPAQCMSCIAATNTLDARHKCVTCTSLGSAAARDTCVACVSAGSSSSSSSIEGDCSRCLDADCGDAACLNARRADRSTAPNLGAVERCFGCVRAVSAAPAGGSSSSSSGSRAGLCARCFERDSVPPRSREACLAGVAAPQRCMPQRAAGRPLHRAKPGRCRALLWLRPRRQRSAGRRQQQQQQRQQGGAVCALL